MIDPRRIHSDDTSGSYVQMTDFAVAHLPGSQANVLTRCLDQSSRKVCEPIVEVRSTSERYCVTFAPGRVAKSIEDNQDKRRVLDGTQFSLSPKQNVQIPV